MGIGSAIESAIAKGFQKAQDWIDTHLDKSRPTLLSPENELLALDNTAFKINGQWTAEFVISIFDRKDEKKAHKLEKEIMSVVGVKKGELSWDRIKYFVAIPRKDVSVVLRQPGGTQEFMVGPTQDNGIMAPEVSFPDEGRNWTQANQTIFEIVPPPDYPLRPSFRTVFGEETGYGIISDIDDTTKISDVLNRLKLLRHTFLDKHGQPVPGMPELYRALDERLFKPTFFYLSASPWQLYLFLLDFIRANYPFGQIILRDMSFMELSSFVDSLTVRTQDYKENRMEKIHRWFPNKQFICIGDSAQKDPEAYGAICRKYPGWIKAIWIRIVSGVDPSAEKKLNAPERFKTAFKDIHPGVCQTFTDPLQMMNQIPYLL